MTTMNFMRLEDLVPRLYVINGICFILATTSIAYSSFVTHVELNCVVNPIEFKDVNSSGLARAATLAIYSSLSYGFFILLTAIYTFGLLAFSSSIYVKQTLIHHVWLQGVSGLLNFFALCSVSVYCHHHRYGDAYNGQSHGCALMIRKALLVWSPLLIILISAAFFAHLYLMMITLRLSRTSNQNDQESLNDENLEIKPSTDGNAKKSLLTVKSLTVRDNRTRIPSTRQYPGSPILPGFQENLLKD